MAKKLIKELLVLFKTLLFNIFKFYKYYNVLSVDTRIKKKDRLLIIVL